MSWRRGKLSSGNRGFGSGSSRPGLVYPSRTRSTKNPTPTFLPQTPRVIRIGPNRILTYFDFTFSTMMLYFAAKYTSGASRRSNGFLRRPEVLETVYSVEEDGEEEEGATKGARGVDLQSDQVKEASSLPHVI